jgi:uncharacterized protein (TIGR02757 family)
MNPDRAKALKLILDKALDEFVASGEARADAIEPALVFRDWHDRELSAFICSVLAYGRVEHIKKSIHRILDPMGVNPHRWLMKASEEDLLVLTTNWSHRFNTASDMFLLLKILQIIYRDFGSIEELFARRNGTFAFDLLEAFVEEVELVAKTLGVKPTESFWFFFPRPSNGSACKRLNLFLRWMIGRGPLDLKLWSRFPTSILIIPLDVHVLRQARSLGLTRRKQADWQAAIEVTESLKSLDREDPVQFDFALCHLGMKGQILKPKNLSRKPRV